MYNLALICVRGNSKGVKNKNIKSFCGKPLIFWTINQIKKIKKIDRILVSTDSKKISLIAKKYGAEVLFLRPKKLSRGNSPEWAVWKHALNFLKNKENVIPKLVINVPVTSPCRKIDDIKRGLKLFEKKNLIL